MASVEAVERRRTKGREKQRKSLVALAPFAERRLKPKLRRACPSEPWVDAQFTSLEDADANGDPIVYRYHDPKVFPPGGNKTAMVACSFCGVLHPPAVTGSPLCAEHAVERIMAVRQPELIRRHGPERGKILAGEMRARLERAARQLNDAYGQSPSANAIREMQMRNLRLQEKKLPSAKAKDLRREIRRSRV